MKDQRQPSLSREWGRLRTAVEVNVAAQEYGDTGGSIAEGSLAYIAAWFRPMEACCSWSGLYCGPCGLVY